MIPGLQLVGICLGFVISKTEEIRKSARIAKEEGVEHESTCFSTKTLKKTEGQVEEDKNNKTKASWV